MVRNRAFILDLKAKHRDSLLFTAAFNKPDKLPITLTGTLELERDMGAAFTVAGKLNSKTSCGLSSVFLNGFLRLFSDTPACRAFAQTTSSVLSPGSGCSAP